MAQTDVPPISSRIIAFAATVQNRRRLLLDKNGLSPGHDDYLLAILRNDGITMGDLSGLLSISASSTTKIATRLEGLGLMRREASRLDSRLNHAHLTEAGERLAAEIVSDQGRIDAEMVKLLKPKDIERLQKILDRLENKQAPAAVKPRKAGKKKTAAKKARKAKK